MFFLLRTRTWCSEFRVSLWQKENVNGGFLDIIIYHLNNHSWLSSSCCHWWNWYHSSCYHHDHYRSTIVQVNKAIFVKWLLQVNYEISDPSSPSYHIPFNPLPKPPFHSLLVLFPFMFSACQLKLPYISFLTLLNNFLAQTFIVTFPILP